ALGAQRAEVAHRRDELRVFLDRFADQLVEPGDELLAAEFGVRVDGPFRPVAVPDRLDGLDPAVLRQGLHGVVERTRVDLERRALVALAQRGRHFVRVHRAFQQQAEQGQREGVADLAWRHWSLPVSRNRLYDRRQARLPTQ